MPIPVPLLSAIATAFGVEAFGVALAQFVDVALRDVVHAEPEHRREGADVPEAVAQFLRERVLIERRGVKEMLLDHFGHFTSLTREAEGGVGELLFVRAVAPECAGGEFLILVEGHRDRGLRTVEK